jgi:heme oxygenase
LRRDFRAALDALSLTPTESDALVAETLAAYARHQAVFDEISAAPAPT